mgnify:CR=1 FL=1
MVLSAGERRQGVVVVFAVTACGVVCPRCGHATPLSLFAVERLALAPVRFDVFAPCFPPCAFTGVPVFPPCPLAFLVVSLW